MQNLLKTIIVTGVLWERIQVNNKLKEDTWGRVWDDSKHTASVAVRMLLPFQHPYVTIHREYCQSEELI